GDSSLHHQSRWWWFKQQHHRPAPQRTTTPCRNNSDQCGKTGEVFSASEKQAETRYKEAKWDHPVGQAYGFQRYHKDFDKPYTIGKLLGHGQFGYTCVAINKVNADSVTAKKNDKNKRWGFFFWVSKKKVGFSD
ncbi:hypothetical protein ES288_A03G040700v1, partial [Gossypium darwinii]